MAEASAMSGGTAKLVHTGNKGGDTTYPIKLYVYYKTSQDVSKNQSTITLGMYVTQTAGSIGSWTDNGSYLGTKSNTFTHTLPNTSDKEYWIVSGKTMTVNHNSDGTGKATIYWKWGVNSPWGRFELPSGSFEITLPTIPRKSSVSATNANVGSNSTITISRASSSFTHTLTYTFGSLSGTIATKTTSTSVAFTLPTSFYAQIGSTATSKSGTITCETFNGSTSLGTTTCSFTATTSKANDAPTLSPSAYIATDSTTYALTGSTTTFIKGYTNVTVATGAAARNSATLKSQKIENSGQTINAASGTITAVTSGTFSYSATDSRGYTTTTTLTRSIVNYVPKTCNFKPRITVDGTATISINGNIFNGSFGAVTNTLTVQYRYRVAGGTWGSWTNVSASKSGNTYSATATVTGLDYRTKYGFQARVTDKIGTTTANEQTVIALPVFDWGEDGFNFNVPVNFAAGYTQTVSAIDDTLVTSDFIIEQGTSGDWTYRKWNSGLAECWARIAVNTAVQTQWGGLYVSGSLSATNLTFPFTFTAIPMINVNLSGSGSGAFIIASGSGSSSTTKTGIYEIARGTSAAAANYGVNYDVRGRWK